MKVGILDFGFRDNSLNSLMKINDLIIYAQEAESLGYSRFWLAEHYFDKSTTAWTNPIPLIPILCQHTNKIRVGTGGIILKLHDVLDIATSFKLYNNVFKNRIDLGVVNGRFYNEYVARLSEKSNDFDEMFGEVVNLLKNEETNFEKGLLIPPFGGSIPQTWAMSTSQKGCERALRLGTNFARSIFHTGADMRPQKNILDKFKTDFYEKYQVIPSTALAVSIYCKKDHALAHSYFNQRNLTEDCHIIGSVNYCADKIYQYYQDFGVDEIIIRDILLHPEERLETISDIAQALNINSNKKAPKFQFKYHHG